MSPPQERQPEHDPLAFPNGGEMGERTRSFDWSQTPIGSLAAWPPSLKTAVRIMLNSRFPMFVWWGDKLINLYNDAYSPLLGKRHPDALGRPAAEVWADIWPVIGPLADAVLHAGQSTWNEELLLVMERNRFTEETYFTFSYSPVPHDDGGAGGVFCAVTEDTQRVLSRRRLRSLRALAEQTAEAKTPSRACELAALTLCENQLDLPFVLLYLLDNTGRHATLAGLTGLDRTSPACPASVDLALTDAPWPFAQVAERGAAVELFDLTERFGPLPGGAWPESPQRAIVLPMAQPGQTRLAGFVVAGVSPRLPFTDDYKAFMQLLAAQVATAVTHARAYEEERRQAAALEASERRFRNMADNAPVMIWVTDQAGVCTYLNANWYRFTGTTPAQSLGLGWLESVHPEDRERSGAIFLAANERQEGFQLEYRLRRSDGEYRIAIDAAAPWHGDDGTFLGYIGSVIDITDLKLAEAEKQRLLVEAQDANRLKDEFLSMVSHEMRTPLNAILGWAGLLNEETFESEELQRGLIVIEQSARLQARLIEDLLDVEQIRAGNLRFRLEPLNLTESLMSVVEMLQPSLDSKQIQLELALDPRASAVTGDRARMQQIIWNLLSNAIKFTPPGGRVQVSLTSRQGQAQVVIRDSGVGIPGAFLPHVFERFRQADASPSRSAGGLGLGLTIVRELVGLHHGTIQIESPGPGCGTTVEVSLPLIAESL